MSKPKKLKLKDFIYPPFLEMFPYYVVFQLFVLIPLLGFNPNNFNPIDLEEDCEKATIIVEQKYLENGFRSDKNFYVVSNGYKYYIPEDDYTAKKLNELVDIGERIDIYYTEESDSENTRYVYDAKGEYITYVSIDSINKIRRNTNIICLVAFVIMEAFLIFVVCSNIDSYTIADIKKYYKNLKKKIDKIKKYKEAENQAK